MELIKKQGRDEEEYEKKEATLGAESMRRIEKIVCLRTLDFFWMDHLEAMDHLRDSVRLRAYGQQDPLIEYKNEGHRMFRNFLDTVESAIVKAVFAADMPAQPSVPMFSEPSSSAAKKVGRNDPCPCSSGKKYKKCCYPKYGN